MYVLLNICFLVSADATSWYELYYSTLSVLHHIYIYIYIYLKKNWHYLFSYFIVTILCIIHEHNKLGAFPNGNIHGKTEQPLKTQACVNMDEQNYLWWRAFKVTGNYFKRKGWESAATDMNHHFWYLSEYSFIHRPRRACLGGNRWKTVEQLPRLTRV